MNLASRWSRTNCLGGILTLAVAGAGNSAADYRTADSVDSPATTAPDRSEGLIPRRLVWPGVAVIIVLAVIATAALTGPIIRANSDDQDNQPPGPAPSE